MTTHASAARPTTEENEILDTSTEAAATRWDDLLTLQTELFFPHELDAFLANEDWPNAATALDVGCGNGHYVSRLATFFPDKAFVGLDLSPALIASANARPTASNVHFVGGDYFSYRPAKRIDAILMRFVVQHLTDMAAILRKASSLLTRGGNLFIVEPELSQSASFPPTPLFTRMLNAYETHAAAKGRIRAHLTNLPMLVQAEVGWSVASDRCLSIPNAGPFSGRPLAALFGRWIDLCEHAARFPFAYDAVRREIEDWGRHQSFSRICLRLIQLKHAAVPQSSVRPPI